MAGSVGGGGGGRAEGSDAMQRENMRGPFGWLTVSLSASSSLKTATQTNPLKQNATHAALRPVVSKSVGTLTRKLERNTWLILPVAYACLKD